MKLAILILILGFFFAASSHAQWDRSFDVFTPSLDYPGEFKRPSINSREDYRLPEMGEGAGMSAPHWMQAPGVRGPQDFPGGDYFPGRPLHTFPSNITSPGLDKDYGDFSQ